MTFIDRNDWQHQSADCTLEWYHSRISLSHMKDITLQKKLSNGPFIIYDLGCGK